MLGAIAGDIIGSRFEWDNIKHKEFNLFTRESTFTDDTVLTVALAASLMDGQPYGVRLKEYARLYPNAGYGGSFKRWAHEESLVPYNSFGNGSAMRVSAVAWFFDGLDKVQEEACKSAAVTHNHTEGIKGAQAVAAAIFMARSGMGRREIRSFVEGRFDYDLSRRLDHIRPGYTFDVTCQGSVPEAIIAFLESSDFEDAIRNAISIGGDSDTIACITGAIAEAFYGGVPAEIVAKVWSRLDDRLTKVVEEFMAATKEKYARVVRLDRKRD